MEPINRRPGHRPNPIARCALLSLPHLFTAPCSAPPAALRPSESERVRTACKHRDRRERERDGRRRRQLHERGSRPEGHGGGEEAGGVRRRPGLRRPLRPLHPEGERSTGPGSCHGLLFFFFFFSVVVVVVPSPGPADRRNNLSYPRSIESCFMAVVLTLHCEVQIHIHHVRVLFPCRSDRPFLAARPLIQGLCMQLG